MMEGRSKSNDSLDLKFPGFPRAVSVRARMAAALLLLAVMAAAQAALSLYWTDATAFMLMRAETSHDQIDLYQQISASLDDLVLDRIEKRAPHPADQAERVAAIGRQLARLDESIRREVDLVLRHGGTVDNSAETRRLRHIRSAIGDLVAAADGPAAAGGPDLARLSALYHGQLQPLLDDAMARERRESDEVVRRMAVMRTRLHWIGMLCLALPLLTAGMLAGIVGQTVLGPVSRLVKDVKRLGRGHLSHRIVIRRHDEFGLLASHINRMAGQLDCRNRRLLDYNESLEAMVRERTLSLHEANEDLRRVDESRRRFFADVSHELRTPLTTIVGEAEVTLAVGGFQPEPYREAIAAILANAGYLKRRIDDLLAIARAEDGRLRFGRARIDLAEILAEVVTSCEGLARANAVVLRATGTTDATEILGDRSWIRQCLLTLVDNAIKFSRPGQAVRLILSRDGHQAQVAVADEGEGVAAEDLPKLFERFYQTGSGQRAGGTGLGLSVARWIVEEHGGTIQASSRPGGGTTITMRFPGAIGGGNETVAG